MRFICIAGPSDRAESDQGKQTSEGENVHLVLYFACFKNIKISTLDFFILKIS